MADRCVGRAKMQTRCVEFDAVPAGNAEAGRFAGGVKKSRVSGKLFWVAVGLAAAGCVLPWVKTPAMLVRERFEAAGEILRGTQQKLGPQDFLWVDGGQTAPALEQPFDGATVWHLAFANDAPRGTGGISGAAYAAMLLGWPDAEVGGPLLLLVAPLGVLILSAAAIRGYLRQGAACNLAGMALLAVYVLIRWRIAVTEGARVAAGIQIGIGLWLTALAALLGALLFFARAAFPKARWF